jgi:hypothetical protein
MEAVAMSPGKDYAKRGDHIQITKRVYLNGKWLEPGTVGIIKNPLTSPVTGQRLYIALIDGQVYALVPAEFQVINEVKTP